ncbi:hypothetical protein JB92DRAFT_121298 [Gautieria morchelliformis]|nr:hypothetical protein JB92DRAFT_121298 [Gautieria morchelliformis]
MAAFTLTRTQRRSPTSLLDPPAWTGGQAPGRLHGGEGAIAAALGTAEVTTVRCGRLGRWGGGEAARIGAALASPLIT